MVFKIEIQGQEQASGEVTNIYLYDDEKKTAGLKSLGYSKSTEPKSMHSADEYDYAIEFHDTETANLFYTVLMSNDDLNHYMGANKEIHGKPFLVYEANSTMVTASDYYVFSKAVTRLKENFDDYGVPYADLIRFANATRLNLPALFSITTLNEKHELSGAILKREETTTGLKAVCYSRQMPHPGAFSALDTAQYDCQIEFFDSEMAGIFFTALMDCLDVYFATDHTKEKPVLDFATNTIHIRDYNVFLAAFSVLVSGAAHYKMPITELDNFAHHTRTNLPDTQFIPTGVNPGKLVVWQTEGNVKYWQMSGVLENEEKLRTKNLEKAAARARYVRENLPTGDKPGPKVPNKDTFFIVHSNTMRNQIGPKMESASAKTPVATTVEKESESTNERGSFSHQKPSDNGGMTSATTSRVVGGRFVVSMGETKYQVERPTSPKTGVGANNSARFFDSAEQNFSQEISAVDYSLLNRCRYVYLPNKSCEVVFPTTTPLEKLDSIVDALVADGIEASKIPSGTNYEPKIQVALNIEGFHSWKKNREKSDLEEFVEVEFVEFNDSPTV